MSASDDPAGAVGERTWTIYVCLCGSASLEAHDCYFDAETGKNHGRSPRKSVEVVSADWRAAALKLADDTKETNALFSRLYEQACEEGWLMPPELVDTDGALKRTRESLARVRSLDKEGHGG